jgi:endonuclease NucS-like protein
MAKAHYVVLKNSDGSPKLAPMKTWLRENPQAVPEGLDARASTSYQLRRALCKKGWELEELHDRTLLIKPDENEDTTFADELREGDSEARESNYEEEIAEAAEITFGLERDLQSALRVSISQLELGLKIIDGGKERKTDAGWIDITAQDQYGNIVIIELKAGPASPDVIAQVLAYMGAVAEADKKPVRGILVAGDFHKRVIWASRAISNLELRKYSFQFTFESVE